MKVISDLDYQKALQRLAFIEEEKIKYTELRDNKFYAAHFKIFDDFSEVIIDLKRENEEIDLMITMLIKSIISTSTTNLKERIKLKKMLFSFLKLIMKEKNVEENNHLEILELMANHSILDSFYKKIEKSIERKQTNLYLINYLTNLNEEYDKLTKLKLNYEAKQNKQVK